MNPELKYIDKPGRLELISQDKSRQIVVCETNGRILAEFGIYSYALFTEDPDKFGKKVKTPEDWMRAFYGRRNSWVKPNGGQGLSFFSTRISVPDRTVKLSCPKDFELTDLMKNSIEMLERNNYSFNRI